MPYDSAENKISVGKQEYDGWVGLKAYVENLYDGLVGTIGISVSDIQCLSGEDDDYNAEGSSEVWLTKEDATKLRDWLTQVIGTMRA